MKRIQPRVLRGALAAAALLGALNLAGAFSRWMAAGRRVSPYFYDALHREAYLQIRDAASACLLLGIAAMCIFSAIRRGGRRPAGFSPKAFFYTIGWFSFVHTVGLALCMAGWDGVRLADGRTLHGFTAYLFGIAAFPTLLQELLYGAGFWVGIPAFLMLDGKRCLRALPGALRHRPAASLAAVSGLLLLAEGLVVYASGRFVGEVSFLIYRQGVASPVYLDAGGDPAQYRARVLALLFAGIAACAALTAAARAGLYAVRPAMREDRLRAFCTVAAAGALLYLAEAGYTVLFISPMDAAAGRRFFLTMEHFPAINALVFFLLFLFCLIRAERSFRKPHCAEAL